MARRCDYEEKEYPEDTFRLYEGGPLYEHLDAPPRHLSNGLEIEQSKIGPRPGVDYGSGPRPDEWRGHGVSYGHGPMGDAPDREDG